MAHANQVAVMAPSLRKVHLVVKNVILIVPFALEILSNNAQNVQVVMLYKAQLASHLAAMDITIRVAFASNVDKYLFVKLVNHYIFKQLYFLDNNNCGC